MRAESECASMLSLIGKQRKEGTIRAQTPRVIERTCPESTIEYTISL